MADDVYKRLREFLDKLPGQYPQTESGVEIRLLKKLFTPEEAEMVLHLSPFPEIPAQVAEKCGKNVEETAEMLESLAKQGSIYRFRVDGNPMYLAIPFIVGIFEFHLNTLDREMAEMVDEYMPYLAEVSQKLETKQLRVVPIGDSIEDKSAVATYDSVRNLIEDKERFAVATCICRKERGLLGAECERPHETCLTVGYAADYYIENGIGREITKEEFTDILDKAEESALVLAPTNAKDIMNICCCCKCCCGMLRALGKMEKPASQVLATYRADIDPDECTLCETCLERCQIDAIVEGDDAMEVDLDRCIGCGLCVPTCPVEAISMVKREEIEEPPANIVEMSMQINRERGLA